MFSCSKPSINSMSRALHEESIEIQIPEYFNNKISAISLVFDDNNSDHYNVIAPLLRKYNVRSTFGIVANNLNEDYISGYSRLHSEGFELASHSLTHKSAETLDEEAVVFELAESKRIIDSIFNTSTFTFIHPNNRSNEYYDRHLAEYYFCSRIFLNYLRPKDFIANLSSATNHNRFDYILQLSIQEQNHIVIAAHGVDNYGYEPILKTDLEYFISSGKSQNIHFDTFKNNVLYQFLRENINIRKLKNNDTSIESIYLELDENVFNSIKQWDADTNFSVIIKLPISNLYDFIKDIEFLKHEYKVISIVDEQVSVLINLKINLSKQQTQLY